MKALSLFSGLGGIDLACEWAQIKTAAFCERDVFCQKVLQKHWPDTPIYGDVHGLTKERLERDGIGKIDIIHGGFPCQPWSEAAGDKAKGKDDDRHLWPEMFRLIREIRPAWVLGENVANFARMGLDDALADLESIGYTTQSFIIPACAVEAPHERKRTFIVAHANRERDNFPEEYRIDGDGAPQMQQREHAQCQSPYEIKAYVTRSAWRNEPGMARMADGVSNRVERCRALGNAVVPQQIYPIIAAIKQIDDLMQGVNT